MLDIKIKTNAKELGMKLNRMSGKVKDGIQRALDAAQATVWTKSRRLAPIRVKGKKGFLRSQIKPIPTGSPFKRIIKSGAFYSSYVHEGTRRWPLSIPPKAPGTVRQYFKVAGEQSEREIISHFQRAINNALK